MKRRPKGPPPPVNARDDRIRLRSTSNQDFTEFVKACCWSEFEGCACNRPKGHTGLHKCGSIYDTCPQWDDKQAGEWWEEFKKDL